MTASKAKIPEPISSLWEPGGGDLRGMPLVPSEGPGLEALKDLSTDELFSGQVVQSRDFARCVHAGLYLYYSALDESHSISQRIHTTSGSYWHGIMHRMEGDWSNAKYWFRRVGNHPVLDQLAAELGLAWDPFEFIDSCRAAEGGSGGGSRLRARQLREWLLLMRYCHRRAVAA